MYFKYEKKLKIGSTSMFGEAKKGSRAAAADKVTKDDNAWTRSILSSYRRGDKPTSSVDNDLKSGI